MTDTRSGPETAMPRPCGLERSCTLPGAGDWLRVAPKATGLERIEAHFDGHAYAPHRHDSYAIGYTLDGVQSFRYRGARADSLAGNVIVIHPDELHDGEAGQEGGFSYRMLYLEPARIREALGPAARSLPFAKDPVLTNPALLQALHMACADMDRPLEPLQQDQVIALLAQGVLSQDKSAGRARRARIDMQAVDRARDYLDAHAARVVPSEELEQVTQLDRYSLSRQFRAALGTSPYRYLTLRRVERARQAILADIPLAEAAVLAGFSDQPHMTRQFTAAIGMSPGRWRRLCRPD
ncbi:AraC family transcriptional regulator [Tritonibacter scottomollicae]|uniref:AraC family transcriptional regulator n=1 Tax=Tritonibacter scottomollicae TaxID=483013 RepID=A0A2T1AK71_TRISK|nr:AraC family transcriptional regulator [Tritonibacter scottomollicae]PRZ48952.1 AraC family transcriptional regulator [Tritonibacter scottomollicae]